VDGFVAEELGEVAGLLNLRIAVPEAVAGGFVGQIEAVLKVVDAAFAEAPEMVVAALEGAVIGEMAEVPLAHQGCSITGGAEDGGEGGGGGRQADGGLVGGQGFGEADGEPVLVAAGDEGGAGGGADGGVRVALQEAGAGGGDAVDGGGFVLAAAVAGD